MFFVWVSSLSTPLSVYEFLWNCLNIICTVLSIAYHVSHDAMFGSRWDFNIDTFHLEGLILIHRKLVASKETENKAESSHVSASSTTCGLGIYWQLCYVLFCSYSSDYSFSNICGETFIQGSKAEWRIRPPGLADPVLETSLSVISVGNTLYNRYW